MSTYVAVAEKISITLPFVNTPKAAANKAVKSPTIPSRHRILSTEYNTTVDTTGSTDAQIVPNNVLRYRSVSCE
jgi:hypothetical protein